MAFGYSGGGNSVFGGGGSASTFGNYGGKGGGYPDGGFAIAGGGQGGFGNFGGNGGMSSFGSTSTPFIGKTGQGYGEDQASAHLAALDQLQGLKLQDQGATQRAQIAAGASIFPTQVKQQEFGQLLPLITGQLGNANRAFTAGGQSPPSPEISVGPVYNQQQTQQAINAAHAGTDATTGTQMRSNASSLAGRGFGSNSPLLQLLNQGSQMAGNQANALASQSIPFNAAQANATQLLQGQQARENQFASRQQEDIARRTPILQQQTALLSALLGGI